MKIPIKQLSGTMLEVEAEPTDTIGALKGKIQAANADLAAERQKLIYKGMVLKDTEIVGDLDIASNPDAYMVCMLAKVKAAKPAAAAAPAATAAAAPANTVEASAAGTSATAPAPAPVAAPAPAPAAAPAAQQEYATPESIAGLTAMGYPEAEVRAALNAAMGNPDLAFEFLNTGIPDNMPTPPADAGGAGAGAGAGAAPAAPPPAGGGGGGGIEALRQHPQFAALQQTVQQNPAALPQILQVIGSQQPELLEAIHANEAAFLEMMNEPPSAQAAAAPAAAPAPAPAMGGMGGGMPGMGADGQPDPAAVLQMLATLPEEQRTAFAAQMGLDPQQMAQLMQVVGSVPPEQLAQMLAGGGMGGGGAPPPGTIQLTQEEMDAVQRLEALGYSRQQAAQAFLACDRNEMMAANMLMDGGFNDDEEGDNMYN